jgi:DNA-binding NtrC family response regulator
VQGHDELDAAFFAAYNWPTNLDEQALLTRLVALSQQRPVEKAKHRIHYLRPEYQNPDAAEMQTEQSELDSKTRTSQHSPLEQSALGSRP